MTTRPAPYRHADGSNCWTKDCRQNRAEMADFFGGAPALEIKPVPAVQVDDPKVKPMLHEYFTDAMSAHEGFAMFPYIDVDYAVERFRAHMIPPRTGGHNDEAAAKVLTGYIREAEQTYEKRWNPSQFESRAAYDAYAANPAVAPYVDLDVVVADLAEVLDRPEDTSEWELL